MRNDRDKLASSRSKHDQDLFQMVPARQSDHAAVSSLKNLRCQPFNIGQSVTNDSIAHHLDSLGHMIVDEVLNTTQ